MNVARYSISSQGQRYCKPPIRKQTLREVAATLAAKKIGAILVTDTSDALVGIFLRARFGPRYCRKRRRCAEQVDP